MKIAKTTARIALTILATFPETSAFATPEGPDTVTVSGDRGGHVIRYALQAKRLEASGRRVRFAGRCDSACTLYLGMPRWQTCITPKASFGFHLPYGASARGNQVAANYMIQSYPSWVRQWISDQGGLSASMKTMSYSYAKQYMPSCSGAEIG